MMAASLVAVVPSALLKRFDPQPWTAGRTNGFSQTLIRRYPDLDAAMADGRLLPKGVVWSVEVAG